MAKLPKNEIKKRLIEWRNLKNILYPKAKERREILKKENDVLKRKNKQLEKENNQNKKLLEKLLLEFEELKIMKFGKKRDTNKKTDFIPNEEKKDISKKERTKESYRRPKPKENEITDNLRMEIEICPECEEELKNKKEHTHYREDLYDAVELIKSAKKIVKTIVESGKCPKCGIRQSAMEIPKQEVIIGQNIRNMIVFLVVVQGQTYSEVLRSLSHQYGIKLSSGELTNILEGESRLVTPYYEHLFKTLLTEPCHYDETTWKTRNMGKEISGGNYCWIKIGVNTENQIIWFGRSRGKQVAEDLRGEKNNSIGVSDDYGSYKNLFDHHQLCWAHPNRKLRDLAENVNIKKKTKQVCKNTYKDFQKVYKQARQARDKMKNNVWTTKQKLQEKENLKILFAKLFKVTENDPDKLKIIRKTLEKRIDKYFTFFDFPELPLDNNKAERGIRGIVIKRKKSLGSKSAKGANILSILYSVVFSALQSNPDKNFFELYNQIIDFEAQ